MEGKARTFRMEGKAEILNGATASSIVLPGNASRLFHRAAVDHLRDDQPPGHREPSSELLFPGFGALLCRHQFSVQLADSFHRDRAEQVEAPWLCALVVGRVSGRKNRSLQRVTPSTRRGNRPLRFERN